MREIKFRAWWPTIKEMQYFDDIGFLPPEGDLLLLNGTDMNDESKYHGFSGIDEQMLMQYTGLKDKNGQEIYEGDIVKCVARPEYKSDSGNREIYWGHDFGFCFRSPPTDEYEYTHGLPLSWGGYESVEVIGNIYENPDLKEEKEN